MKPIKPGVLNFRVVLTCCFLMLMVQFSRGISVTGNISVQQGSVEGAVVHTIMDGYRLDIHKVDNRGKYKLELACNHKYELIFAQEGNYSTTIVVETLVPKKVLQSNSQFNPIGLDVNLFTEIEGVGLPIFEKPIRKIYFNPVLNDFISDVYFNDTQITRQIEKAVFHAQIINQEIDFLSKLSPFELAEMKREYEKIIEGAGKVNDESPLFAALDINLDSKKLNLNDKFSKIRSNEINELLGAIIITAELDKERKNRFDDFIIEADNLFKQQKFTSARIAYQRALSINPEDYYAESQYNLINDLLENQSKDEQYNYLIAQADNSFNELLYTESAKDYRNALLVKPNEQYPKIKLEKVNSIIENEYKAAEKSTSYKQTMKEAEAMYQKQFYEKSLASYINALNLDPGDNQAARKVEEIRNEMTSLADKLMYDKLIASANKLYNKEIYPEAMREYYAAAEIIPKENYALIRINAINQKLDRIEKFEDFISEANKQFASEEYNQSKGNYLEALKINSNDKFAKKRIEEIDNILEVQNVNERYSSVMAEANEMFNANDFRNAKVKFTEASKIKPKEKYPKEKLKETDDILTQITKTNQKYQQAIAKAEDLFDQQLIERANLAYAEAERIQTEETYPLVMDEKIEKIRSEQTGMEGETEIGQFRVVEPVVSAEVNQQSLLKAENNIIYLEPAFENEAFLNEEEEFNEVDNEEELKNIYLQYISQADELFEAKKYVESRSLYYKAWDMKPDENHPKAQISNIKHLLKDIPITQLDKEYLQFIDLADSTFRNNQYAVARGWYNRALATRSNEQYPREQLNEIEKKIAERMAAQSGQQFKINMQKASAAYSAKNYNVARFWYKKALELIPDDEEVKSRLNEIEASLNN